MHEQFEYPEFGSTGGVKDLEERFVAGVAIRDDGDLESTLKDRSNILSKIWSNNSAVGLPTGITATDGPSPISAS